MELWLLGDGEVSRVDDEVFLELMRSVHPRNSFRHSHTPLLGSAFKR